MILPAVEAGPAGARAAAPAAAAAAAAAEAPGRPIDPPVVERPFAAPADPWAAGHRGLDLAAAPGAVVRALRAGRIAFVGDVAGTPVLSIDHGGWRSTYQPVIAEVGVRVGDAVDAGAVIGRTAVGGGHCAGHCLHLGVIADGVYRDPLPLLRRAPILKPLGARPLAR